jgi:hypothetical protein
MSNQLVVNNASLLAIKIIIQHISDVEFSDNELDVIVSQVFKPELTVNTDEHLIILGQLSDDDNQIKIVKASSAEMASKLFYDHITAFEDGGSDAFINGMFPLSLELASRLK